MRDKIYKFGHYTKKHGIKHALLLARNNIQGKPQPEAPRQEIFVMTDIEDVVDADFLKNPYKKPKKIKKEVLDIGWVLSPISAGSGGQNTIVRFAKHLQKSGHNVTFYLYEAIHPQRAEDAQQILKESFKFDVMVRPIADYKNEDVVIATGWETAYPVFNLQTNAHKFYFVQDFEPYFYGLGSKSVLAENTYRFNFHGITAGKWLTHRLSTEYGMKCDFFDFGVDVDIYKPANVPQKKKKICFYARPVTERRAFELGVIALDTFHKKHPEYEIEFFGWDVGNYKLPFPFKNRGVLSHNELAELYQESVACLVLSLTNVSLLPFELLAAGCAPVMNDGDNNRMVLGENKFIEYTGNSPVELAVGLDAVVTRKNDKKYIQNMINSVEDKSWEQSYQKVEDIIKKEVTRV